MSYRSSRSHSFASDLEFARTLDRLKTRDSYVPSGLVNTSSCFLLAIDPPPRCSIEPLGRKCEQPLYFPSQNQKVGRRLENDPCCKSSLGAVERKDLISCLREKRVALGLVGHVVPQLGLWLTASRKEIRMGNLIC